MTVSFAIMVVMAVFMAIGALDIALFSGRLGYGAKFTEGIGAMGPLASAMLGLMCIAPVLGDVLAPIATPFFALFGADPAMLAGSILAMDMGGYPLATALAGSEEAAIFAGCLYSSTLGCTLSFSIPVALGILKPDDRPPFTEGVLAGLLAIAPANFIGGLIGGLPLSIVLPNSLPALLLTLLIALGLWKKPQMMMRGFTIFSRIITAVIYLTLAIAIIEGLTGFAIIPGMAPIGPELQTVGLIGITLAGTYPFMHFLTKVLGKPLGALGGKLGVNKNAMAGMLACLANIIPLFGMVKDMDRRGKVVAIAFAVPASFVFGDYLAYMSANLPGFMSPFVVTKLLGGLLAIGCAMILTRGMKQSAPVTEA